MLVTDALLVPQFCCHLPTFGLFAGSRFLPTFVPSPRSRYTYFAGSRRYRAAHACLDAPLAFVPGRLRFLSSATRARCFCGSLWCLRHRALRLCAAHLTLFSVIAVHTRTSHTVIFYLARRVFARHFVPPCLHTRTKRRGGLPALRYSHGFCLVRLRGSFYASSATRVRRGAFHKHAAHLARTRMAFPGLPSCSRHALSWLVQLSHVLADLPHQFYRISVVTFHLCLCYHLVCSSCRVRAPHIRCAYA